MAYSLDDDDGSYGGGHSSGGKDSLFGWTILILLLIGVAFACWLGSFQIFGHPEKPSSYSILKKLGKIDPPKRFELTKAPPGKFWTPKELYDHYATLTKLELQRENDELMRNYLRNYTETKKPVVYVVGKFDVIASFDLKEGDLIPSGVVALAQPIDYPNIVIEHLFPASGGNIGGARANLVTGADLQLKKSVDLSALIHVEKIYDGRLLFTVMPLLYGSYAVRQGGGGFDLEPPADVNLASGAPVLRSEALQECFRIYAEYQRNLAGAQIADLEDSEGAEGPGPGLVRIEKPLQPDGTARATPVPEETPIPVARAVAVSTPGAVATPMPPALSPSPAEAVSPQPVVNPTVPLQPFLVSAQTPTPAALGAGSWKVYAAGNIPPGRVVDVPAIRNSGSLGGERVYLQGDFFVTASGQNRAVLRSRSSPRGTRVLVSFPSGSTPPPEGASVKRGAGSAFQVMDIRKGADGETTIYVREITAQ